MGSLRHGAIRHGGRNSWCIVTKVLANPFRTPSGGSTPVKKCTSWWRSYKLYYLIALVCGILLIQSCECFAGSGWHDRLGYTMPSRLVMISEKNKKINKYVLDEVGDDAATVTKCPSRKTLHMSEEEAKMELPVPTVKTIVKNRRTSSKAGGVGGSLKEADVNKECTRNPNPYEKVEAGAAAVSKISGSDNPKQESKSEAVVAARRRDSSKRKKNDMMSQFLYSMGQIDLLTASEEVKLARYIQRGLEYEKIRADQENALGRGITYEEWAEIAGMTETEIRSEMVRAQKARAAMISANLRLVVSIAKRYQNRGMQLPDLVQEGIFGLTRATEKFNPEKGFKFSTYATWWIKQSVLRSIADQGRVIRLPVHVHDFLTAMKRGVAELTAQNLRAPTDEELSRHLECSTQKIEFIREATQGVVSMSLPRNPNSLKEVGPGKMQTLQDQFRCGDQSPEEHSQDSMLKENVKQLLYTLSPREQEVVRLRFGIENGQAHTLEEIGSLFQITRERVRQIESRALNKLRQPYRNYKLQEFMVDSVADQDLNEAQYNV